MIESIRFDSMVHVDQENTQYTRTAKVARDDLSGSVVMGITDLVVVGTTDSVVVDITVSLVVDIKDSVVMSITDLVVDSLNALNFLL
uniref:Uncharacterized protein n=1 Tax=Glossina brevipalpis TaxID=37001 RepID=A0A1A9WQ59_9MUSC